MALLKNGSRGDAVKGLQQKLGQLGFDVQADGIFGPGTEKVVKKLQSAFGYDVDGLVGDGTLGLVDKQVSNGWNFTSPDAMEKALRSQGKRDEADALEAKRLAGGKGIPGKSIPGKGDVSKDTVKGKGVKK